MTVSQIARLRANGIVMLSDFLRSKADRQIVNVNKDFRRYSADYIAPILQEIIDECHLHVALDYQNYNLFLVRP
ncbi:MAG: hypothetical protein Q7U75_07875 [Desulfobacterales bacterium]|nr:hypothetical protein [Desulfobacterales bacterium]